MDQFSLYYKLYPNECIHRETPSVMGLIAEPAAITFAISIGARVTMGGLALGCNGLSKVADYAGKKDLSESLNNLKNNLVNLATHNFKIELLIAGGLAAITAAKIYSYGIQIPPGPICMEDRRPFLFKLFSI